MHKGGEADRLRPQIGNKPSRTGLKMLLIVLAGMSIGLLAMTATSKIYKNTLLTRVKTIAESLDSSKVVNIKGTEYNDGIASDYSYLRQKLARVKAVNADSRFVYLMARNAKGEVYFLADSEPQYSREYSARGEVYPEASDQLKGLVDTGKAFVEGPSKDSYGTWLSALAPVIDDSDETYRLTAIVGMDVPATTYALLLGLTGGIPLLLALLAAAVLYVRHQNKLRHHQDVQFRAEMLSIASHELRTPLTGLRWSQESLMSHKLPPAGEKRAMEIMYDSTLRLQESIEDILQLANVEAGKYRLYKKDTDLREMMVDIVAMQQLAADRMNIKIAFSADWPAKLLLNVDKQRLKRVYHNLLSNAIKYSRPDTTIVIGYKRANDGGHIISFEDHGIGIPESEQSHVWDGFFRASNTTAHDINGTGMGLYLARQLVDQHGGKTWLESVEGQGTTVYTQLPDTAVEVSTAQPLQTKG